MRIVSLLPSATEMICLLGLENQLVGLTHECDFPTTIVGRPVVTRSLIPADAGSSGIDELVRARVSRRMPLYQLDLPKLMALQPDLIVTQALCDVCAVDETEVLRAAGSMPWQPKVLNLEPVSLRGVLDALKEVAIAAGVFDEGRSRIEALKARIAAVANRSARLVHRPSVVFLEWIDPLFCSGHWNPELTDLAGGRECIGIAGERSRRIEWDAVREADPEVLFIACCGFTAERTMAEFDSLSSRPGWENLRAVRDGRAFVADGSAYFNRPGPRLVDSLEMLAHALHPELFANVINAFRGGPCRPVPGRHARAL